MLTLHSKVVGNIVASQAKIQKKGLSKIIGSMPLQELVKTDSCKPYDYNRDTKVEWATKCLQAEGGFNWQLFGSIEGIKNPKSNTIEIWDGLGRLCMAQLANIHTIPVIVHKEGTPGALFVKKQKLRNRSVNNEAHFVSYCSALSTSGGEVVISIKEDAETQFELSVLNTIGVRVESGVDNFYPQNIQTQSNPKISISAVRRSLKLTHNSITELQLARNAIFSAWPSNDNIGKELFEGLVLLFRACPNAGKNGTYTSICDFLTYKAGGVSEQKAISSEFKALGGNQHNDEARSVAVGLWDSWNNSKFPTAANKQVLRKKHIDDFVR
jgi:hypothetical protein